ncbi:MAG TPA: DUF2683 family protein [Hanamia sp.]|jgi:hypothetical protein
METITIHPQSKEQANLFEQLAKTLKVPFEKTKKSKSPYDTAFEKKMKKAEEDKKAGRYKAIKTADIWK